MKSSRLPGIDLLLCALLLISLPGRVGAEEALANSRRPTSEAELRFWLENMVGRHHFSMDEVQAATGLSAAETKAALVKFGISAEAKPSREGQNTLLVLPYPGGRHPRIGFLEGAIRPQRETKFSVFLPWDPPSYVVVDLPEAIWSQLGLLYLAHSHVPTIWTKQGVTLPPLEWERKDAGILESRRSLPNGVAFGARVVPAMREVRMELWLTNGSNERLSDLRVQNCVMLKGARGFSAQTNANKILQKPYAACRSEDGRKWIITAWHPCQRVWANAPVPCFHSDPQFPDCAPGESARLRGWLSFFEGDDIFAEFQRIDRTHWMDEAEAFGAAPR